MTFEEFKKTCFHTRTMIKIPILRSGIEKSKLMNKKGHFDQDMADRALLDIFEDNKLKDK